MSKIEKMLQCSDCKDKLDQLCEALEYNDAEREIAAEVLLWLEMGKLKKSKVKDLGVDFPDATKPSVIWNNNPDLYTVKC